MREGVAAAGLVFFCLGLAGGQETTLLGAEDRCDYLVPSAENGGDGFGDSWTRLDFLASPAVWREGRLGIGYDGGGEGDYLNWIHWEILPEMRYENASLFVRVPFEIDDAGELAGWKALYLKVRFEDGFVMWLNGERVASFHAPADEERDWRSEATANYPDGEAVREHLFDLSEHIGVLRRGENLLAIQGLNNSALSQDFMMAPELVASAEGPGDWRDGAYLKVVEVVRDEAFPERMRMTFGVATGRAYRLEGSEDGVVWETEVAGRLVRPEDGFRLTLYEPIVRARGERYYRLVEEW